MHDLDHRRLLIVDDNEAIHEDFRKILGQAPAPDPALSRARSGLFGNHGPATVASSFDLTFASQGAVAMDLARKASAAKRPFSVAIVDGRMPPGWDGLTTIQNLWTEFPDLQVVFCTAFSDHGWEEICRRLGRPDSLLIVKKPFDPIEIRQAVTALSRKWQLARESQVRLDDLRKAQRQVQSIIDYSPSLVSLRGLDGRFLLVNGGFCHRFGVTRESIFGRTAHQAMSAVLADHLGDRDEEVLRGGRTIEWEAEIGLPGGERSFLITKFPLYGLDGAPYAIASIHTDLSRRKAREETDRHHLTMRALCRMAGSVAHDFNNLLTAIVGHHDLAIRRLTDDHPARRQLEEIGKAACQATGLAERLLRFSRRQVQVPQPVDLAEALPEIAPSLQATLGPDMVLSMPVLTAPLVLQAEREQLGLVLQDLAALAREGMSPGGEFAIKAQARDVAGNHAAHDLPPGRYVEIIVTASGPDLTPEQIDRLFDPFSAAGGGLAGLGLAGTRSVITQFGGTIACTSAPGRGMTFHLLLPRPEEATNQPAVLPTPDTPRARKTVLVAEDEEAVRDLLVGALKEAGYEVLVGADGQEALGAAWSHPQPIDLLVTDAIMPRLGGAALADRLIARHPQLRVVFMSGYTESQAIQHQIPEGRASFIQKPFSMADLVRVVRDSLETRSGTGIWAARKG